MAGGASKKHSGIACGSMVLGGLLAYVGSSLLAEIPSPKPKDLAKEPKLIKVVEQVLHAEAEKRKALKQKKKGKTAAIIGAKLSKVPPKEKATMGDLGGKTSKALAVEKEGATAEATPGEATLATQTASTSGVVDNLASATIASPPRCAEHAEHLAEHVTRCETSTASPGTPKFR